MSAGAFTETKYQAEDGYVYPIRVQPETVSLTIGGKANDAPAGSIAPAAGFVRVSGGKRTYGITPRKIAIRFTGALPSGYKAGTIYRIPVLDPANYASYISPKLQTGTYLSQPILVVGKSGESGRA